MKRAAVALALALACAWVWAQTPMYRWVDDKGIVHYTDQIPPGQVDRGHAQLSDQGIPVQVVPPVKTAEELAREGELERLRAQQERLLKQQDAADRALLRTFRSPDDLIRTRDSKLASIDAFTQVAQGNIRRQQAGLLKLRTEAADLERTGKPIPPRLTEGISESVRSIRESYATIVEQERQKEEIWAGFERDLKRFLQLKAIRDTAPAAAQGEDRPAGPRPALDNLVTCDSAEQCDRFWGLAVAYVTAHATTPVQTSEPNILMTAPPQKQDDLSVTLSRIPGPGGMVSSLFLDVQCKHGAAEESGCSKERGLWVLKGFRAAVTGSP